MKVINCIILLLVLTTLSCQAQQAAQYTMHMLNLYHYNNAYNGLDESLSLTGVFRKQWVGFAGSPLNVNFNAHMPIEYINSGVGIGMEYDQVGAYDNISVRASYSYMVQIGEGKLSIGLGGRFLQKSLDDTRLLTPDGEYGGGNINHNDPLVPAIKESGTAFSMDAGLYYKHPKFEVGISASNLTQPNLSFATDVGFEYTRTYFFSATYNWDVSDKFSLHPHLLLKTDFIKVQPELAVILDYNDNIFGGLAFRGYDANSIDAVVFLVGMQITPNFKLAYSYDLSIGSLVTYNSGSHEVMLNYNFNKKIGKEIPSKIIYNPRFL